jgi:hypothetical protein
MATATVLRIVSLAAALVLLIGTPPPALADQVVPDDAIVQGNLCVGTPCLDGEVFSTDAELKLKGALPTLRLVETDPTQTRGLRVSNGILQIIDENAGTVPFAVIQGAPSSAFVIDGQGRVGLGPNIPSQQLHVQKNQNANTFFLVQNATDNLNANAVVRTQSNVAIQNFQSHASSRTLVRWGVPLGGWNEFLAVAGSGLAMGTLGNAPFILGTGTTARMSFDGDSNVISFGGGGQYDGNSFLDASSRALKQDIRPLGPDAAIETLAGLEPVTFAYTGAAGDPRVGFVAEDVPELVATPGRQTLSALEIVAVLTKVVKEQQKVVRDQQKVMQEQRQTLQEQQKALADLTSRLTALEARP